MSNLNLNTNTRTPYNVFDLSHVHKTSMQFGKLYPVYVGETLPGDTFNMNTVKMIRALPLVSPVMHNFTINEHWFYVPNRILWDGWEEFITVRQEGDNRILPTMAVFRDDRRPVNLEWEQTLGVYMGLPYVGSVGVPGIGGSLTQITALPLAGYVQIWNNYYRQTQIMAEAPFDLQDGINESGVDVFYDYAYPPLSVLWKRDYFTAALPSPTLGIDVPMMQDRGVYLNPDLTGANRILQASDHQVTGGGFNALQFSGTTGNTVNAVTGNNVVIDPNGQWQINIGTIETLRSAFALQAYLEKENRSGGRYKDVIQAHFDVELPDYRVSIPEYIGSTYQNLVVSEVLSQTENTDAPLGEMAGHGISVRKGGNFKYTTLEHGYLYCLVSIVPELVLANRGLHKMWRREHREDFAFPSFANLGEQEILNEEINANHTNRFGVWGYIPRYSEMKYAQSLITGQMSTTLSHWHLGQTVASNVALNSTFLFVNPSSGTWDLTRIFGYESGNADYFVADIYFDIKVRRALPRYDLPMTLGHI